MKNSAILRPSKYIVELSLALIAVAIGSGCSYLPFLTPQPSEHPIYLACNVWCVDPSAVYSLNYKQGAMIPAGTEVRDVRLYSTTNRIHFKEMLRGKKIKIIVNPQLHPNLSLQDLSDRLFTDKKLSELTAGMTEREIYCIKTGEVRVGIGKAAVLTVYGWPDDRWFEGDSLWHYWLDRGRTQTLRFDSNGILTAIEERLFTPENKPQKTDKESSTP